MKHYKKKSRSNSPYNLSANDGFFEVPTAKNITNININSDVTNNNFYFNSNTLQNETPKNKIDWSKILGIIAATFAAAKTIAEYLK